MVQKENPCVRGFLGLRQQLRIIMGAGGIESSQTVLLLRLCKVYINNTRICTAIFKGLGHGCVFPRHRPQPPHQLDRLCGISYHIENDFHTFVFSGIPLTKDWLSD